MRPAARLHDHAHSLPDTRAPYLSACTSQAVDAVVAAARDHLGDKDDVARALAVAALWKLVDTSGVRREEALCTTEQHV